MTELVLNKTPNTQVYLADFSRFEMDQASGELMLLFGRRPGHLSYPKTADLTAATEIRILPELALPFIEFMMKLGIAVGVKPVEMPSIDVVKGPKTRSYKFDFNHFSLDPRSGLLSLMFARKPTALSVPTGQLSLDAEVQVLPEFSRAFMEGMMHFGISLGIDPESLKAPAPSAEARKTLH